MARDGVGVFRSREPPVPASDLVLSFDRVRLAERIRWPHRLHQPARFGHLARQGLVTAFAARPVGISGGALGHVSKSRWMPTDRSWSWSATTSAFQTPPRLALFACKS